MNMRRPFPVLLFLACACTSVLDDGQDSLGFKAVIEDTRTVLNGVKVYWQAGDELSVNGNKSTGINISSDRRYATFDLPALNPPYRAVYPASAVSGNKVVIPAAQTYTESSFDTSAALMLAYSQSSYLSFSHAVAYLKFNFEGDPGHPISRIELSSLGNEDMSGFFTFDTENIRLSGGGNSGKGVILNSASGIPFGVPVYVAVAARNYASGIKVRIVDPHGYFQDIRSPKAFDAQEGYVYRTSLKFIPSGTLLGGATGGVGEGGEVTFRNPVWSSGWPDPTVFPGTSPGSYVSFSTEGTSWKNYIYSKDLVHWTSSGKKLISSASNTAFKALYQQRWAPQYVYLAGSHRIYLSAVHAVSDGKGSGIAVFSSDRAEGPYEFLKVITWSLDTGIKDSIDPFIVSEGGKVWMVFGSTGGVHIVELASDGLSIADGASYKHIAGKDVNEDKTRMSCYEGSYLYRRGNWWYLFLSAGYYANSTYYLVVGRSTSITGPYKDINGVDLLEGKAPAILSTEPGNELVFGPGHNGEIITDASGQDYIFYHCHYKENAQQESSPRVLFLQRLFWDDDGWPYFETGHPLLEDRTPYL